MTLSRAQTISRDGYTRDTPPTFHQIHKTPPGRPRAAAKYAASRSGTPFDHAKKRRSRKRQGL